MVLVLSKQQVAALVTMPALIDAVEAGLIELSAATAINPNRLRVFMPERQAMMACMPAYPGQANALGAKIVASSSRKTGPGEPRPMSALTLLADTDGRFLSVMYGTHLGALRTAAASAVAIRHLAPTERIDRGHHRLRRSGVGGTCGALTVRMLSRVHVYDSDRRRRRISATG